MSAVLVEIGADATAFQKAVDGLPARMNAASGQMAAQLQAAASSGTRAMGSLSLQVQDVAVQLQSGAKWSTVMAQQGTQMLSAFGAGGAIAGGVLGLGMLLYQLGDNARKSFEEARKSAEEFEGSLKRLLSSSDPSTLVSGIDQFKKVLDEPAKPENKGSVVGVGDMLYAAASPYVTIQDLINAKTKQLRLNAEGVMAVEDRIVQLSEQHALIAELRAAGRRDEADEMERQLKLAEEIARVEGYGLSPETTAKVVQNVKRQHAQPDQRAAGDVFQSVMGSFSRMLPEVIGPVAQVIQQQLNERAQAINAEASALRGAAFGGLRGDVDTTYGRGHSINPLNNGASRMVSELLRQSSLLQQQAKSMDKGNAYLAEIEKAVKKFSPSYQ